MALSRFTSGRFSPSSYPSSLWLRELGFCCESPRTDPSSNVLPVLYGMRDWPAFGSRSGSVPGVDSEDQVMILAEPEPEDTQSIDVVSSGGVDLGREVEGAASRV